MAVRKSFNSLFFRGIFLFFLRDIEKGTFGWEQYPKTFYGHAK